MSNLTVGATRRLFCNVCKGETWHELKAVHERRLDYIENEGTPNEYRAFWEKFEFRLWVCRGCDTGLLEEAYQNEGMYDASINDYAWESDLYPKRAKSDLPHKSFKQLNKKLSMIYREVIDSYNNDLRILCAVGLRALLEGICADKQIAGKTLQEMITGLRSCLPPNIVDSLHSLRFMGNDAIHDLQPPQRPELSLAIEVVEDLLNFLYELEYKAKKLPQKT